MHDSIIDSMTDLKNIAQNLGEPNLFLLRFTKIHRLWHITSPRIPGFLIFHWYAVQQVKDLGLDNALGVNPYTANDFRPGGQFHSPATDWDARMGSIQPAQSLNDLATISRQIENWHNGAHGTIGNVLNTPEMHDPSLNVFLTMFWNLHFLINQKFEEQLLNYANAAHPELSSAREVIEHIEQNHHDVVNNI